MLVWSLFVSPISKQKWTASFSNLRSLNFINSYYLKRLLNFIVNVQPLCFSRCYWIKWRCNLNHVITDPFVSLIMQPQRLCKLTVSSWTSTTFLCQCKHLPPVQLIWKQQKRQVFVQVCSGYCTPLMCISMQILHRLTISLTFFHDCHIRCITTMFYTCRLQPPNYR